MDGIFDVYVWEGEMRCVANQGLAVLSPNDTATGKRVADFLASEAGQSALRSLQTGVTIASIKTVDLGVLAVP